MSVTRSVLLFALAAVAEIGGQRLYAWVTTVYLVASVVAATPDVVLPPDPEPESVGERSGA